MMEQQMLNDEFLPEFSSSILLISKERFIVHYMIEEHMANE
jgi:hypothetical protein